MAANRLERFAHNLDWNLLRTFVVVVEEGSITAAANRLLLQQPAVSMALKRLEQTIGHRLIDRRPGRFELTEAGARLHAQCRDIFSAVVRLPSQLEAIDEDLRGHVAIHTVSHVHNPHWEARLGAFFREHPKVSVTVVVQTTADVIHAVERGVATIGLCDGVIPDHLEKSFYKREYYGLYCGRGHRLFGVSEVAPAALRSEPYVAFTADVLGGQHMNAVTAARAIGGFGHQVRAVTSHVEEAIRLVAANVGIGMLPVHHAALAAVEGDVWLLPLAGTVQPADVWRITNPVAALSPAETAFLRHVAETEAFVHGEREDG